MSLMHVCKGALVLQAKFATCCKTLTAYCRNVYTSRDDPAKRRINLENKAFQQRVAAVPNGREFLHEVGFQVRVSLRDSSAPGGTAGRAWHHASAAGPLERRSTCREAACARTYPQPKS